MHEVLNFWQVHLQGLPDLEFPTDRSRPPSSNGLVGRVQVGLEPDLAEQLRQFSEETGFSLSVSLLSVWYTLLRRYSRQTDFAIGFPSIDKSQPEIDSIPTADTKTFVLRIDPGESATFRRLVTHCDHELRLAFENSVPFDKLVDVLVRERHPGRHPLFQVVFDWRDVSKTESIKPISSARVAGEKNASFDLALTIEHNDDKLIANLGYNSELFDAGTAQRMSAHFCKLLSACVAHPDTSIDQLPLMSDDERRMVVQTWNQTQSDYPQECISRLFEQQAATRPNAIAAISGQSRLTYQELNRRSNRLARHLQKKGIGHDTPVGISIDRSFDMLVGLLAILKVGGVYVPLDSSYPDERLSFLLNDTEIKLILIHRHSEARWRSFDVPLLNLDDATYGWSDESDENLIDAPSLDSRAYIIFTSGSTGVPKGVEVLHRGIVRLLFGVDYVQLDESQSILQLATLSFDASTFEIWGALLHGGRCVLAPAKLPEFQELQRLIQRENVRTLWLTSTLFNAIVDEKPELLTGIEQLLVGGEALSLPHIRRAQQALGKRTQIINGYGPTETTTFACCYRLPIPLAEPIRSIPIGRPIGNTTAYVLDPNGEPVPIGVPGELLLGGGGLARGYLKRLDLTAEKFVPDRFGESTHGKLYRTGDLVRWLADGNLEFLGRIDGQVKLRGFRIELGEIDAALLRHPSLKQAATILREDRPGAKRLVAYCVADSSKTPPTSLELRNVLSGHLPDYMIPSAFMMLDAIPRNQNGKLERRALPEPVFESSESNDKADALWLPEERLISSIWCKLLGIEQIGLHDNFFELGGHSLLVLRMIDAVNKKSVGQLKPADVFLNPTVSSLASCLVGSQQTQKNTEGFRYIKRIRVGRSKCTIISVGTTLESLVKWLPDDTAIWWLMQDGIHLWPHLDLSIPQQAAAFVAELESAKVDGQLIVTGFSYGGALALETARQLTEKGRRDICLVLLEPTLSRMQQQRITSRMPPISFPLTQAGITYRINYFTYRFFSVMRQKYHSCRSYWLRFRGREIPLGDERWHYMRPFLRRHIHSYAPSGSVPVDLHLFVRPEHRDYYRIGLQDIIGGKIVIHDMPKVVVHEAIIDFEHSREWTEVIRQLVDGEVPNPTPADNSAGDIGHESTVPAVKQQPSPS